MPAGAGRRGERFCLFHPPRREGRTEALGAIVHLHAFAEEMNKSRRMVALQARALAHAGYAVMQIDLLGCGDSSGDFGDATWSDWIGDVQDAVNWLRTRCAAPLWLWGHRAGALLAVQAAAAMPMRCDFLFWQPATSGKAVLQQFLRLKAAAAMRNGGAKAAMASLKERLAAGETVEVAGYGVSSKLAAGLESATLTLPPGSSSVRWLDVSQTAELALSPVAMSVVERLRSEGHGVSAEVVRGAAFWQASEIEEAPELLRATLAALRVREAAVA